MDKDGFLAEIRATHDPLAAAAGEVPDAAWHAAVADMDGWTRKDVLAHVGWWSDHSARVIAALTAGEVPYDRDEAIDINAQNASIREQFLDRDPVEVRAFESAAFERLVAAVEGTSEEDLFAVGRYPWLEEQTLAAAVEWDSTKHFPEHVPHLAGPREPADALETVALSAIAIPHIGSAVVFVLPDDGSALVLAAAAGIEGPPLDRLTIAVRDPEHPVARTLRDGAAFDVRPTAPGGPALRSHLPLLVARGDRDVTVGVLAVAHDHPLDGVTRESLAELAEQAAIAVNLSRREAPAT